MKKSCKEIKLEGITYIKSGGYPIDKSLVQASENPDYSEIWKAGYLFLLKLHRFTPVKKSKNGDYIPFNRGILENGRNIALFFEWIDENKGEGVMIEFKGETSKKREERNRIRDQMVAMANTMSGVLISGIFKHNDRTIEYRGVIDPDEEEKSILNLKKDPKLKNVEGELQQVSYKGKIYIFFFIKKPSELASFRGKIFKRNGRQKEEVPIEEIKYFLKDHYDRNQMGYVIFEEFRKWKENKNLILR